MKRRIISALLCLCMILGLLAWIPPTQAQAATASQQHIVDRANYMYNNLWTCQRTVRGWRNNYTFYQGNRYHVPYGQPVSAGAYVGFGISFENFLKATQDPNNVFYTARSNYAGNTSTYYANDCSAFVSYCWGIGRRTTATIPGCSTYIGMATAANAGRLQLGDCLNSNSVGHVVLVTGISWSNGTQYIEITEQTPPQLKRTTYSAASLGAKYGGAYGIYRYGGNVPAAPNSKPTPPKRADLADGVYVIKSAVNNAFTLNINGPSKDNGANVHLWSRNHDDVTRFVFQRKEGTNCYTIRNLYSGKYLDVASGVSKDGTNVQQYDYNGSDAQLWYVSRNSDGTFTIISKCGDKALDLYAGGATNGANIQIWEYNATAAQKWSLEAENVL